MLDFWNPITLFRRGRTEISVSIPTTAPFGNEVLLTVPWELPADPNIDLKPNPLWLVITLADDGKLSLNNEPAGSLSNTDPLTKRLQELFKEREANGVFREGNNETEKSVTIVMPMSGRKFSDLVTVAEAVWLPGANPIALAMDNPLGEPIDFTGSSGEPKGPLDTRPIPRPRKKP